MKNFFAEVKDYFGFSKRERSAVLVLSVLILALFAVSLFPRYFVSVAETDFTTFDSLIKEINQTRRAESPKQDYDVFGDHDPDKAYLSATFKPFPFDPNKLPEESWRKLGLSEHQIKAIKNYEKKGGKFFRKEDLAKIYTISETEYKMLEPYIQIETSKPKHTNRITDSLSKTNTYSPKPTFSGIVELNTVDSISLIALPGIGPWFAHRIIQYRQRLGGFVNVDQLLEVKGIDSSIFEEMKPHIDVDSSHIVKRNLNRDTFKQLLSHPYIDMEMTKFIVNHREKHGHFASWENFSALTPENTASISRLRPYATF
ncbi:MAG: helix-hairpin-helix domain-containing protein [Bacteroidales bacterium]|nr:helix-hairpin-helix domain-containing protein [Bacteroidales bacterium]